MSSRSGWAGLERKEEPTYTEIQNDRGSIVLRANPCSFPLRLTAEIYERGQRAEGRQSVLAEWRHPIAVQWPQLIKTAKIERQKDTDTRLGVCVCVCVCG